MSRLSVVAIAVALGACAAGPTGRASYGLDQGPATYDSLKTATEKCHADGGNIVLKSGYDNRELSNYDCKIGEAR